MTVPTKRGLALGAVLLFWFAAGARSQVEADGGVDGGRYYSNAETNAIMEEWTRRYPTLTKLSSIGKSYLGADLMLLEVGRRGGTSPDLRPALYVDGNIHSGELTGAAVALYLAEFLLTRYGNDPQVTALLDTRVFYIRPKFNPDGADLALEKGISLRSTVHPWDNDGDGQADEDPGEDLNGDGYILRMRVADKDGGACDVAERLDDRADAGDVEERHELDQRGVELLVSLPIQIVAAVA